MAMGTLARRYAKAFVEISAKKGIVDAVGDDLLALAEVIDANRDLQVVLQNPAIDAASRLEVLGDVLVRLGGRAETRAFVAALIERGRLGALSAIAAAYRALADELAGRVRAEVISAERLDDSRMMRIQRALEASTGKAVVLSQREDPALVAGVVTKIGSWIYDGSLRNQLRQLRETLRQAQ